MDDFHDGPLGSWPMFKPEPRPWDFNLYYLMFDHGTGNRCRNSQTWIQKQSPIKFWNGLLEILRYRDWTSLAGAKHEKFTHLPVKLRPLRPSSCRATLGESLQKWGDIWFSGSPAISLLPQDLLHVANFENLPPCSPYWISPGLQWCYGSAQPEEALVVSGSAEWVRGSITSAKND